jgi:hypothetical protein
MLTSNNKPAHEVGRSLRLEPLVGNQNHTMGHAAPNYNRYVRQAEMYKVTPTSGPKLRSEARQSVNDAKSISNTSYARSEIRSGKHHRH